MFVGFILPGRATVMERAYEVPTRLCDRTSGCSDNCGRIAVGDLFSASTSARVHRDIIGCRQGNLIAFRKGKVRGCRQGNLITFRKGKVVAFRREKPTAAATAAAAAA